MKSPIQRRLIATVALVAGLTTAHGGALAQVQQTPIITGNVTGNCVTSPSANTTGANAGDWTITCGDISPGSGLTVIGPPAVTSDPAPVLAPAPVAAPEPAPVAEPAPEMVATATEGDLDADNYADALEWELGLDPSNADTDGDGVADGDEITIYFTAPTVADTDGDGILDGEELFGIFTDPLVWEEHTGLATFQALAQEAVSPPEQNSQLQKDVLTTGGELSENLSATSGDSATLGTGDASAAPGTVTRDGITTSGTALLGPDGTYTVNENTPPEVSVSGATSTPPVVVPAPGSGSAPVVTDTVAPVAAPVETTAAAPADTTVASPTDLDGDNFVDAEELAFGLDPANPDVDGDGVADGDEVTIYLTDPWTWDTDGDGISDGEELFGILTDPLVWDTDGDGLPDGAVAAV